MPVIICVFFLVVELDDFRGRPSVLWPPSKRISCTSWWYCQWLLLYLRVSCTHMNLCLPASSLLCCNSLSSFKQSQSKCTPSYPFIFRNIYIKEIHRSVTSQQNLFEGLRYQARKMLCCSFFFFFTTRKAVWCASCFLTCKNAFLSNQPLRFYIFEVFKQQSSACINSETYHTETFKVSEMEKNFLPAVAIPPFILAINTKMTLLLTALCWKFRILQYWILYHIVA